MSLIFKSLTCAAILSAAGSLVGCGGKATPPESAAADPVAAAVEGFLDRYFEIWSGQDMDGYGALFDDDAVVQFVAEGGRTTTWNRNDFLQTQIQAHQLSPSPMREFPLSKRIAVSPNERAAQASVRWKLVSTERQQIGWNHFTLLRRPDGWRILHLVFYSE